jgi:hypothetical protein
MTDTNLSGRTVTFPGLVGIQFSGNVPLERAGKTPALFYCLLIVPTPDQRILYLESRLVVICDLTGI